MKVLILLGLVAITVAQHHVDPGHTGGTGHHVDPGHTGGTDQHVDHGCSHHPPQCNVDGDCSCTHTHQTPKCADHCTCECDMPVKRADPHICQSVADCPGVSCANDSVLLCAHHGQSQHPHCHCQHAETGTVTNSCVGSKQCQVVACDHGHAHCEHHQTTGLPHCVCKTHGKRFVMGCTDDAACGTGCTCVTHGHGDHTHTQCECHGV